MCSSDLAAGAWIAGQALASLAMVLIYFASVSLSAANTYNPFIYFRF